MFKSFKKKDCNPEYNFETQKSYWKKEKNLRKSRFIYIVTKLHNSISILKKLRTTCVSHLYLNNPNNTKYNYFKRIDKD